MDGGRLDSRAHHRRTGRRARIKLPLPIDSLAGQGVLHNHHPPGQGRGIGLARSLRRSTGNPQCIAPRGAPGHAPRCCASRGNRRRLPLTPGTGAGPPVVPRRGRSAIARLGPGGRFAHIGRQLDSPGVGPSHLLGIGEAAAFLPALLGRPAAAHPLGTRERPGAVFLDRTGRRTSGGGETPRSITHHLRGSRKGEETTEYPQQHQ